MRFKILIFILMLLVFGPSFSADTESTKSVAGELFINLPVFTLPVIQARQLKAIYSISVILEVQSREVADHAQKMSARLIDGLFTDLYGLLSVIWEPQVHIPLTELKKRLYLVSE